MKSTTSRSRLVNDSPYDQLSNPSWSPKLGSKHGGNYQSILQYFHYLSQGFNHISFFESISLDIKDRGSHLDQKIVFEDFDKSKIWDALRRCTFVQT